MAQKDSTEKNLESFPDVFADVINALLYKGKLILSAADLQPAPTETLYSGITGHLRNQFQDVGKYEMSGGNIKIQYTIENETRARRKMILRKMGYEGALYRSQAEQKYNFPVVSLVLYWGKGKWMQPQSIHQFFAKNNVPEEAYKYIDNSQLHVFEMAHLPVETRKFFQSDMRIVADYLAEGKDYIPTDQKICHLEALLLLLRAITNDGRYEEILPMMLKQEKEKGEITMCELLDKYENKGKSEGENRMAQLIQKLLGAHREEDLLKASENVEYRNQLFQEFGIA